MTTPFDYVKSINKKDEYIQDIKDYNSFIVNRAMSLYNDCVLYANEVNNFKSATDEMKYAFYYYGVPKNAKRFAPWPKKESDKYISIVMEYYGVSLRTAIEYISILTNDQLDIITKRLDKGGKV